MLPGASVASPRRSGAVKTKLMVRVGEIETFGETLMISSPEATVVSTYCSRLPSPVICSEGVSPITTVNDAGRDSRTAFVPTTWRSTLVTLPSPTTVR